MRNNFHYEILATLILKQLSDFSELKNELLNLGTCLDISLYKNRARIHIHSPDSENKETIRKILQKAGELTSFSSEKEHWKEEES